MSSTIIASTDQPSYEMINKKGGAIVFHIVERIKWFQMLRGEEGERKAFNLDVQLYLFFTPHYQAT